ncbi:MAG: L,D-transpeptidase family protein [Gammaproteobacteria bacterium]
MVASHIFRAGIILCIPATVFAGIDLSAEDQGYLDAIIAAEDHGLVPSNYELERIELLLESNNDLKQQEISAVIQQAYRAYSKDVSTGRLPPLLADPDWRIPLQKVSADKPPSNSDYQRLKEALASYRDIEQGGGWPEIPPGPNLSIGVRHKQVSILRNWLRIAGDYDSIMLADPYYFDLGLEQAVKKFRVRHGMAAVGTVNKTVREMLDVPVKDRISQIIVAMERWRWLPRNRGEQHVWVNLANAEMHIFEHAESVFTMRVVVGRHYRSTPSFRSEIDRIVFNPTWSVPRTIAIEDILPQQKNDAHFISRKHIRVFKGTGDKASEIDPTQVAWNELNADYFPYRLRQDAGPKNSLGRLKFMFENPYDIYMHDTPAKLLFHLPKRAFSSGCVRLEKPVEFAAYLLEHDKGWGASKVESQIDQALTKTVRLNNKIPVYFVYLTSWVTKEGDINFREDVYGRDAKVAKALNLRSREQKRSQ